MTISKAFNQLEMEGVLIRQRGIGMLVSEQGSQADIPESLTVAINHMLELATEHSYSIDELTALIQQQATLNMKD